MPEVEALRYAAQGLRVSQEQIPSRSERFTDPRHHRPHDLGREVHRDVSAKDDIEGIGTPERGIRLDQIALFESSHRANAFVQDEVAPFDAEMPPAELGWCFSQ
jgi:hypothetical protein